MIDAAISRLKDKAPALNGRVYGAGILAALMSKEALPEITPVAYVVPLGFRAHQPQAATGAFVQAQDDVLGVMLCLRSNDRDGRRALESVQSFMTDIPAAFAGWRPAGSTGAFRPVRAFLAAAREGTMWWQFEFAVPTHLRITPT